MTATTPPETSQVGMRAFREMLLWKFLQLEDVARHYAVETAPSVTDEIDIARKGLIHMSYAYGGPSPSVLSDDSDVRTYLEMTGIENIADLVVLANTLLAPRLAAYSLRVSERTVRGGSVVLVLRPRSRGE